MDKTGNSIKWKTRESFPDGSPKIVTAETADGCRMLLENITPGGAQYLEMVFNDGALGCKHTFFRPESGKKQIDTEKWAADRMEDFANRLENVAKMFRAAAGSDDK